MSLWRQRLTPRERQTLDLLALGYSNREIAGRMGTSQQTARNYTHSVFRALGVHDRTQAAVMALKFEIVDPAAVYAALDNRRRMMIKNGGFVEGWHDIGGEQQQPAHWVLRWVEPGRPLYDSDDKATGRPECTHKLAQQLPPNEQRGAANALILVGDVTYKIFGHGVAFAAELSQRVTGLQPGTIARLSVPVLAVLYGETDHYAAESGAWLIGERKVGQWANAGMMGERQWYRHVVEAAVPDNGALEVVIRVKSKYANRKDFFIDGISLEAATTPTSPPEVPPPGPDWQALQQQAAALRAHLQQAQAMAERLAAGLDEELGRRG